MRFDYRGSKKHIVCLLLQVAFTHIGQCQNWGRCGGQGNFGNARIPMVHGHDTLPLGVDAKIHTQQLKIDGKGFCQ